LHFPSRRRAWSLTSLLPVGVRTFLRVSRRGDLQAAPHAKGNRGAGENFLGGLSRAQRGIYGAAARKGIGWRLAAGGWRLAAGGWREMIAQVIVGRPLDGSEVILKMIRFHLADENISSGR